MNMDKFINAVIGRMNKSGTKKSKKSKKKATDEQLYDTFVTNRNWESDDSDNSDYEAGGRKATKTRKRSAARTVSSSSSEEEESDVSYDSDESDDANQPSSSRRQSKNGKRKKEAAVKAKKGRRSASKKSPKKPATKSPKKAQANGGANRSKRVRIESPVENIENGSASNSAPLAHQSNGFIPPQLPAEVWARIFCYVIADVGTMPFLLRIAKVAKVFRDAAWNTICWRDVRLDAAGLKRTRECLEHFSESFIGRHTRRLSLSRWEEITFEDLDMILSRTPKLTSLDISFCRALEISEALDCLSTRLPQLRSLDLTYIHEFYTQAKPIKADVLIEYLKSTTSANLRHLYLNGNYIGQVEKLLHSVNSWSCAGELQTLDMSGVNTGRSHSGKDSAVVTQIAIHHSSRPVDLGILAKATPKLVTLRLAEFSLDYSATSLNKEETVWPLLETIDLACELILSQSAMMTAATNSSGTRPSYRVPGFNLLQQLFTGCRKLKEINLNGISGVSLLLFRLDDDLPLEQLHLRRCRLIDCCESVDRLRKKVAQYLPTLRELDLGWINEGSFATFVNSLFTNFSGEGKLVKVNLIGSPITTEALRALLDRNQHLEWIDLTSCRSVSRGCKRLHSGAAEIQQLRRAIKQ